MSTPSNKKLVVPNGKVTDSIITNFSEMGYIRLELEILVSYEESTTKIKDVILEALKESKYIMHDNPILMGIESYDTHNVQMAIRPSIDPDLYWEAIFECNSLIKDALSANGIKMAYSEGIDLGPIGPG